MTTEVKEFTKVDRCETFNFSYLELVLAQDHVLEELFCTIMLSFFSTWQEMKVSGSPSTMNFCSRIPFENPNFSHFYRLQKSYSNCERTDSRITVFGEARISRQI